MDIKTVNGYLLLADISGFEEYLMDVELEHAQDIIKELLELLADQITPTFKLADFQTDAVYAHLPDAEVDESSTTMLPMLDSTYTLFRNRIQDMHRSTTCTCQACQNVPQLDLKFMLHHAEYTMQPMEGKLILGGLDSNLMQKRAFKDQVPKEQRGYVLITDQGLQALDMQPTDMAWYSAEYEVVGQIGTNVMDMKTRYQKHIGQERIEILPEEADLLVEKVIETNPATLWAWLNDPGKRNIWMEGRVWTAGTRVNGRLEIGAENHCDHGSGKLKETILDWQPHEYFTVVQELNNMPMTIHRTYHITQLTENKSKLSLRVQYRRLTGWLLKWPSKRYEAESFKVAFETLAAEIAKEK